ncbi:hypothetical protein [Aestuariirhabdus sp. LZHN29]|uniref:hypothetical protein n=1 Tax=Aestuariirhabdus sp. LZHN29 TaxID=3417462 RepID=UPI003CFBB95B
MKMRWLLAPVLLGGAAIALAQPGGFGGGMMGGYGMHGGQMGNLYQALDLTDEQKLKAEEYMRERRVEAMAQRMGLDDDQKQQMATLMESHQEQRAALFKKYDLTQEKQESFYKDMQAMREAHHAAMGAILTDEQRAAMPGRKGAGFGIHHRGFKGGPGAGYGMGDGHGMKQGYGMGRGFGPGCNQIPES